MVLRVIWPTLYRLDQIAQFLSRVSTAMLILIDIDIAIKELSILECVCRLD